MLAYIYIYYTSTMDPMGIYVERRMGILQPSTIVCSQLHKKNINTQSPACVIPCAKSWRFRLCGIWNPGTRNCCQKIYSTDGKTLNYNSCSMFIIIFFCGQTLGGLLPTMAQCWFIPVLYAQRYFVEVERWTLMALATKFSNFGGCRKLPKPIPRINKPPVECIQGGAPQL